MAFGYLSVLLGFLALTPDIARRIAVKQESRTLQPLISSIEIFIQMYRSIEAIRGDDDEHDPQGDLMTRWQAMADDLSTFMED